MDRRLDFSVNIGTRFGNYLYNSAEIIYLIFDYPHNYYTFKHFKIQENTYFTTILPRLNEP